MAGRCLRISEGNDADWMWLRDDGWISMRSTNAGIGYDFLPLI